jgi:hypothetical protein
MWGFLLAWSGEVLLLPFRRRWDDDLVASALTVAAVGCFFAGVAARSVVAVLVPLVFASLAAGNVAFAFVALERARIEPLAAPSALFDPRKAALLFVPTAIALHRLALALDAVRRDQFVLANQLLDTVDRARLRSDHIRLMEGVRANVTLALGDRARAAQQALAALPTGSEDLDARLGRLAVESAWTSEHRLVLIDRAWEKAGIAPGVGGALPRLRLLVALKLASAEAAAAPTDPAEASALAEEARAVGDERLALDLEVSLRRTRGYR